MKTIRLHYLQHVPFEGLGYIETWANSHHCQITSTKFYGGASLPEPSNFDWLVVMGGPMSINDEEIYPWLKAEKQFIRSAIEAGKVVLGVCLGAQLIAGALGSKIYPNKKKEIGWFPVSLAEGATGSPLMETLPESFTAMHWHGETFDLPAGATRLIKTEVCPNQAFVYNGQTLGLQFHLEFTPESLKTIINNCRDELVPDDFIQSEKEILKNISLCRTANKYLSGILDRLIKG